ncbi:glycosyltransferase [Desulfotruncus arcticus]|nr:glycosyltransferase [Desulfotruncus arcticus]
MLPFVKNHVVCEATENLDQFYLPKIHVISRASSWRYLLNIALCKLGIRNNTDFLVQLAKECQASVLHSHFGHTGWKNMVAARRAGLRHLVTFYGFDVNHLPTIDPRWRERYNTLFMHVDYILCEGSHMAKCIKEMGCPEHKVLVHHLGVRADEISFKPRAWSPGEPLRVLIAASFREKKGIPYALEALGRLQHDVPLQITVIGDAGSKPASLVEKERILSVIKKHNLKPIVRMLGFQPYNVLFEEAYKHHVFLSPSITASDGDTEGGAPVTIIEMAATGMPVISTTHCDIPEVILNGYTGLLAEERNVGGLLAHLKWLVSHPDKWLSMLEHSRRHIETKYNAQKQGVYLSEIYRELACR